MAADFPGAVGCVIAILICGVRGPGKGASLNLIPRLDENLIEPGPFSCLFLLFHKFEYSSAKATVSPVVVRI